MSENAKKIKNNEKNKKTSVNMKDFYKKIFISVLSISVIDMLLMAYGGAQRGIIMVSIILLLLSIDGIFLSCMKSEE